MITTSAFAPCPALAPFVHCFIYREFETHGEDMMKPWHASHQPNIIFFLKALPVALTDTSTRQILKKGKSCDIVGMSTKCNGDILFNGSYAFFQIIFEPTGFHKIFDIPPIEIADKIIWSKDIFDEDIQLLNEQLCEAESTSTMVTLATTWLLGYLNKHRKMDYKDQITSVTQLIKRNQGLVDINALCQYACMSARNFERTFLSETGMSPKHLCCIARFNSALELKQKFPAMKWTSIAHQAGYFDQTHLIKDFKRFGGAPPSSLLKLSPLFEEKYINQL